MNVYVQRNDNHKYEACLKNNMGEFFVTLGANGRIYIGFFNAKNDEITDVDFYIKKDDGLSYYLFNKFYQLCADVSEDKELKEKIFDGEDILILSEDFNDEIASKLRITKLDDEYKLTFTKSTSNIEMNSFFVSVKMEDSKYYPFNNCVKELYTDFVSYDYLEKQMIIEEIVPHQANQLRRVPKVAKK